MKPERNQMKPFNLEAALRGEPVCDNKGSIATQVAHFPTADRDFRVAVQWGENGPVGTYTDDGRPYVGSETHYLFMAPRKRKGWLHLMRAVSGGLYACHTSVESERAATQASDSHVATVAVEWKEL